MKNYSVTVSVVVHDKASTYPEVKPIDLSFKENLPTDVDAHRHIRARIGEELTRAFSGGDVVLENKSEFAVEADPLG